MSLLDQVLQPSYDGRSAPHLAALRLFTSLHLDEGDQLDLVGGLLKLAAQAQGGRLAAADYRLLARYHEALGDAEGAGKATAAAERLEEREG
jgi:hypothetical protein